MHAWLPGVTAVCLLPCVKVDQRHGWFFSTRRHAAERLRSEEAEEGRWDVGERAAEREREREREGERGGREREIEREDSEEGGRDKNKGREGEREGEIERE